MFATQQCVHHVAITQIGILFPESSVFGNIESCACVWLLGGAEVEPVKWGVGRADFDNVLSITVIGASGDLSKKKVPTTSTTSFRQEFWQPKEASHSTGSL